MPGWMLCSFQGCPWIVGTRVDALQASLAEVGILQQMAGWEALMKPPAMTTLSPCLISMTEKRSSSPPKQPKGLEETLTRLRRGPTGSRLVKQEASRQGKSKLCSYTIFEKLYTRCMKWCQRVGSLPVHRMQILKISDTFLIAFSEYTCDFAYSALPSWATSGGHLGMRWRDDEFSAYFIMAQAQALDSCEFHCRSRRYKSEKRMREREREFGDYDRPNPAKRHKGRHWESLFLLSVLPLCIHW